MAGGGAAGEPGNCGANGQGQTVQVSTDPVPARRGPPHRDPKPTSPPIEEPPAPEREPIDDPEDPEDPDAPVEDPRPEDSTEDQVRP